MNAAAIFDLLRLLSAGAALVRNFMETASPSEVAALVKKIHDAGGAVDMATVDSILDDVRASGEALDAKIKAAGG